MPSFRAVRSTHQVFVALRSHNSKKRSAMNGHELTRLMFYHFRVHSRPFVSIRGCLPPFAAMITPRANCRRRDYTTGWLGT
jgi:hypothetical protein